MEPISFEMTLDVADAPAVSLSAGSVASVELATDADPALTLGVGTIVGGNKFSRTPNVAGGDTVTIGV